MSATTSTELTEEELVAFAMLHEGKFVHGPDLKNWGQYHSYKPWSCYHDEWDKDGTWDESEGETKGVAARRFLERHKLLPEAT